MRTYAHEKNGDRGQNGHDKGQRDDLGRAAGVLAEDVVDLGLLAVADGSVVGRGRGRGVAPHVEVEDGSVEGLGGAEGADDDAGAEGLGGQEVLDGEVFLGLRKM